MIDYDAYLRSQYGDDLDGEADEEPCRVCLRTECQGGCI